MVVELLQEHTHFVLFETTKLSQFHELIQISEKLGNEKALWNFGKQLYNVTRLLSKLETTTMSLTTLQLISLVLFLVKVDIKLEQRVTTFKHHMLLCF